MYKIRVTTCTVMRTEDKNKTTTTPKLRGKSGIMLGKEPKDRRKQKKSPKTGEITKENYSNDYSSTTARPNKVAVGNQRKIETKDR